MRVIPIVNNCSQRKCRSTSQRVNTTLCTWEVESVGVLGRVELHHPVLVPAVALFYLGTGHRARCAGVDLGGTGRADYMGKHWQWNRQWNRFQGAGLCFTKVCKCMGDAHALPQTYATLHTLPGRTSTSWALRCPSPPSQGTLLPLLIWWLTYLKNG